MVEKVFLYFAQARFDRCLKMARTLSTQRMSHREKSFLLLTASLAELFKGSSSLDESIQEWMSPAMNELLEDNPQANPFLTLMMAFEGSKLFLSSPEEGLLMLEQAQAGARSEAEAGGVLFFRAIFEMNRKENYQEVFAMLLQARKFLAGNQEFSLFSFIRYWNEIMIGHVSNQMNEFKECAILTRQVLLHCQSLGFKALLENCYFNLAFAHQGQKNLDETQHYLEQNLKFWEHKNNPVKQGLALVMAGVLLLQLGEEKIALEYFDKRKTMGLPMENHWGMIRSALESSGNQKQADQWLFKGE